MFPLWQQVILAALILVIIVAFVFLRNKDQQLQAASGHPQPTDANVAADAEKSEPAEDDPALAELEKKAAIESIEAEKRKANPDLGQDAVNFAVTLLKTPYKEAGKGTDGFDCSGFVSYVYKHVGLDLPSGTKMLIKYGEEVYPSKAKPGDLIFFTGTAKNSTEVGHVGIVVSKIGDDDMKFIHSSSNEKEHYVKFDTLSSPGYTRRFMMVKRVLNQDI
jgi:cell wall-associated NlpC family hydrolase